MLFLIVMYSFANLPEYQSRSSGSVKKKAFMAYVPDCFQGSAPALAGHILLIDN